MASADTFEPLPDRGVKFKLTRMPFGVVVFERDTIMSLRTEYHITGGMAGCHPIVPHQERHLGLPLLLMSEEVSLLRELQVAELSGEWHFPNTTREKIRYAVYKSLWREGYYLTEGSKFGGDYLAYPDDPTKVHSTHIVVVKEISAPFEPRDLIGGGRVVNKSNKNLLYGTMDDTGTVRFISARWSGYLGSERD